MKNFIITVGILFLSIASGSSLACSSDFSCGIGYKCVKASLQSSGGMKTVDEYGTRQYNLPDTKSVGPN